jgi:fructose-specific component phosphotransferase system IIB-like protein
MMTMDSASRQTSLAIVLGLLFAATPALAGSTVLIIWDTKGAQVENLTHKLEAANLKVVLSDTNESAYNGKNPALK